MKSKINKSEKLEKNRSLFFQIGLICSLSFCLLAFEYKSSVNTIDVFNTNTQNLFEIEDMPVTIQKSLDMPKPQQVSMQLKIVDNNTKIETETNFQTDLTKIPDPVFINVLPYKEEKTEELEVLLIAEKNAEFPGGESAMFKFIGDNIEYPSLALKNEISGTVYISFVVEPDGSISNKQILRSVGGGCDEEAMRIINIMPKWHPAQQGGKNARLRLTLPISFKIL